MTSAPNHLLRLSGNKTSLVWILLLGLLACAGPKHVAHKPPSVEHPTPPKEEQVKVYDPVSGTYVMVPRSSVKVDTVRWTTDTKSPIITDKINEPEKPNKKNSFQQY